MTTRLEQAGVNIQDSRARELLAGLEASTAACIEPSDVLAAILGRPDVEVARLIALALPAGVPPEGLRTRGRFERQRADGGQAGTTGYSEGALEALRDYERLSGPSPSGGLKLLTACIAARLGSEEREYWQPLDVDRLLRACAGVAASKPLSQAGSATNLKESALPWEDLTERVSRANLSGRSPFDGDPSYAAFFDALGRALHRSAPRHVLLVRERGVGEHAVLIELARRGLRGGPGLLRGKRIVRADCRRVPAEQIGGAIAETLGGVAPQDEIIFCVDGFAHLLRNHGPFDNRSRVMALLADARCRVVGIISPNEYQEHFAPDAEAHELFSVVRLHEPDVPAAVELVKHFAAGLEEQYGVTIADSAVRRAVLLSGSYVLHERLPYKAVKVLRALCDDIAYERAELGSDRCRVTEDDAVAKIAEVSGVPAQTLAGVGERADYFQSLRDVIVGQDHAVREVATELGLIKAGLVDAGKPASVMLFVGQTGTGKTEMAKALARLYSSSKRLKTFTLGNFSEPHSVSGIIGVPPGYVGHDQGGRLVNELNADPYGVFLLDEADKAHPDVMQPFLNLFDEGWVYDQRGVKAYADRAMFILTTNVGQRQIADLCKQGKGIDEITSTMKESLSRIRHTKSNRPVFTAEFLARVKRIIVFRSLDADAMSGICRRLVAGLRHDWQVKRQKTLLIADDLAERIARRAYSLDEKSQGKEGGRVVRKLIADFIESPIQNAISEGPEQYRASRVVSVEYSGGAGGTDEAAASTELSRAAVCVRFCPHSGETTGPAL